MNCYGVFMRHTRIANLQSPKQHSQFSFCVLQVLLTMADLFHFWLFYYLIAATPNTCTSDHGPGAPDARSPLSSPALNLFGPDFLKEVLGEDYDDGTEEEKTRFPQGKGVFPPPIPKCREGYSILCCREILSDGSAAGCTPCKFFFFCFLPFGCFTKQKIRAHFSYIREAFLTKKLS